eukprot:FR738248.1.p4 GENE.FR738248.1~~FR738248.1.p4  ORF type:complete len:102 (+),score=21.77 FR738248.1:799-1104(+)
MFMIPFGKKNGADISIRQFLGGNFAAVNLGNIIGGAMGRCRDIQIGVREKRKNPSATPKIISPFLFFPGSIPKGGAFSLGGNCPWPPYNFPNSQMGPCKGL